MFLLYGAIEIGLWAGTFCLAANLIFVPFTETTANLGHGVLVLVLG